MLAWILCLSEECGYSSFRENYSEQVWPWLWQVSGFMHSIIIQNHFAVRNSLVLHID
jgi:hypothetical protein